MNILYNEVVDPRKAAEVCSACYVHCVFKGLHKAPRIGQGIHRRSVRALISPVGCVGQPHLECLNAGIPVIGVRENTTSQKKWHDEIIYVSNYREAAGVLCEIKAGTFSR